MEWESGCPFRLSSWSQERYIAAAATMQKGGASPWPFDEYPLWAHTGVTQFLRNIQRDESEAMKGGR